MWAGQQITELIQHLPSNEKQQYQIMKKQNAKNFVGNPILKIEFTIYLNILKQVQKEFCIKVQQIIQIILQQIHTYRSSFSQKNLQSQQEMAKQSINNDLANQLNSLNQLDFFSDSKDCNFKFVNKFNHQVKLPNLKQSNLI
ncbi:hypothetical protein ABPG74_019109 [Tetrahymena malaccensis]